MSILTVEKLQTIAPITNALANQVDMLTSFIEVTEVMHLKQDILGEALYNDIITNIENGTLSGNNLTLVDSYLYNLIGWYCFFEASPFLAFRTTAKGVNKMFSENSQALDKDEMKMYRQAILDKAMYWRNATIAYLTNKKNDYPLWRAQYNGDDNQTSFGGYDSSSGIYLA